MKCSVGLQTGYRLSEGEGAIAEFITAESVMATARAAEKAGFWGVSVTDHPFPADWWMERNGHHALDPFVALSFAAAATTRLRLHTNVCVIGYRNPFMAAKSVASLDRLSGGRFIYGAAAGYLEDEFRALGAEFANRNDTADEYLRAMQAAWTQSGINMKGPGFEARGNTQLPRPVQQPHPPIWIGGNSRRAMRRAVEFGDGWVPFANSPQQVEQNMVRSPTLQSPAELKEKVAWVQQERKAAGKPPLEIAFGAGSLRRFGTPDFSLDRWLGHVSSLHKAGVTVLGCGLAAPSTAELVEKIARFGEEVLPKIP